MAATVLGTEVRPKDHPPVALSTEGRRQGTYIVGINGTGKSTLLLNIALQDIQAGDGLCLLDPHGDLIKDVLDRIPPHRAKDVILFDPADIDRPFGLNPFDCPEDQRNNPKVVDRICSEVVLTLKKLFEDSWGPRLEDLLRNSILTLMASPNASLLDMLLLLTDENAEGSTSRVSATPSYRATGPRPSRNNEARSRPSTSLPRSIRSAGS